MPTMAEYAKSGGYERDAQAAKKVASIPKSSSSSSSGSLSSDPRSSYSSSSSSSRSTSSSSGSSSTKTAAQQAADNAKMFDFYNNNSASAIRDKEYAAANKKYDPREVISRGKDQYGDYYFTANNHLIRDNYGGSFGGVNEANRDYIHSTINKADGALLANFSKSNPSLWSGGSNALSSDPRQSSSSKSAFAPPPERSGAANGYVKNSTVDAMSTADQLKYYSQHKDESQMEILRAKNIYDQKMAAGDVQGANAAHNWADMMRQAAGINDSDTNYGNNNQIDPETQRQLTQRLLSDPRFMTPGSGIGSDSTGTGTGTGVGAGTGQPKTAAELIKSMYDDNYSSQSQKLKSSRDLLLAGLAGSEGLINQNTTANLNSNDVLANQRLQGLKEAMANQGLSNGGDNVSAQVGIGTSQQQGVNEINNNKTNQLANVLAQRNAINNNASADDLALMQQLQAQRDGMLLNQSNADRTFDYNASQDAIQNARQSKIDNWNAYMESVGLTGNLGTGAKADWSLLGGTDGAMTLDAKTKYLQQEGVKLNNEMAKLQLADYPAEQKLKMQQLQKQIAEIGKSPYQSAQDIEYDKIKLDTAKEQLDQLRNGKPDKAETVEEYSKYLDNTIAKYDSNKKLINPDDVMNSIELSGLSEWEKYKLYKERGLTWDDPIPTPGK